jgi:hypothetical protein
MSTAGKFAIVIAFGWIAVTGRKKIDIILQRSNYYFATQKGF